ncbi:HDOD domain-containing protein [Salinispirillum sp. LH 10-3-1]|uniref:HDOD domain-containing protein n=1 Tax=Salinispirillum sp. LH 10-3-1 TaxID=2952525 RepID=A0AB38YDP2_9GAMM
MATMVESIRDDILMLVASEQLVLPTPPEIAMRVREVAESSESSVTDLTALISRDPAIAARIIRVTNSPLFRVSFPIQDLQMAISRLGMNYTANLAIGLAMKQMFQATSEMIEERMQRNWQITSRVAAYAAVLAEGSGISPDEATLAALLHRIGVLPVLTYAEEHSNKNIDGITLDKLSGHLHGQLGKMMLEQWNFPASMCDVPANYRKLDNDSANVTHCDLVTAANLLMFAKGENYFGRADWAALPVIERLGLPTDRNHPDIQEIHQRVAGASNIF